MAGSLWTPRFLDDRPRWVVVAMGIALTLAVGVLDYLTGPELASLLFYLVPVALTALGATRGDTIGIGVLAGVSWFWAETLRGREYEVEWVIFWNGLSRLIVFVLVGVLLSAIGHPAAPPRGPRCSHCGSQDTVRLQRNVVCLACRRVLGA